MPTDTRGDRSLRAPAHRTDPRLVLLSALVLGILADLLFRPEGPLSLGGFLFAVAGVGAVALVERKSAPSVPPASRLLLLVALVCMAGMAWRDAESLRVLNLLGAGVAAALAGFRPTREWLRARGVGGYLGAGFSSAVSTGFGPLPMLLYRGRGHGDRSPPTTSHRSRFAAGFRGLLLAIPIVLGFGALFVAADPVFARIVTATIQIDFETVAEHAILIGIFGWLSAGYLRTVGSGAPWEGLPVPAPRPRIGVVEIAVALGLLGALFISFLAVQAGAILGGAEFVERTPGLTYAEYARQGFFALLAVTGLVTPVLLAADWAFEPAGPRDEWTFRALALLLVGLVGMVVVVAFRRLRLYVESFGLTEDRLLAAVIMVWLALVVIGLAATVLRGRRRDFALGLSVSGFVVLAALNVMNPQGVVARANLAAAGEGGGFDAEYASTLGADAVPALLRGLPTLGPDDRCAVASGIFARFQNEDDADWRTWSWAEWRARRLVEDSEVDRSPC